MTVVTADYGSGGEGFRLVFDVEAACRLDLGHKATLVIQAVTVGASSVLTVVSIVFVSAHPRLSDGMHRVRPTSLGVRHGVVTD